MIRVALTFDAEHADRRQCPPGAAEQILTALTDGEVDATFFLQGRWVTAYPDLARSIASAGHLIGNHSQSHAPMSDLSDSGLASDIALAHAAIMEIAGIDPRPWFRCPFGTGSTDARVLAALGRAGYQNVHWNVAAADWEEACTPGRLENDLIDQVLEHGDGAIVLLHSWPGPTAVAMPGIIRRLRASGAQFVTVDAIVEERPETQVA